MAQATSALLLALGLLILSALLVSAINIPDVPEPTCAGGWNIHGVFYPKEQGGCCRGEECCKYEAFKDNPICVVSNMPSCTGTECCKYEEYKNTALCIISAPPDATPTPAPEEGCSGRGCCQYEKYDGSPVCSCSGLDCCQYEEYKNTPLCVVSPTLSEDECTSPPPECQVGGAAPLLLDPGIAGGSKCRGACGPDCPDTCVDIEDQSSCMPDSKEECFYVCTYHNAIECTSHESCQIHDDCYDACAEKGETNMCLPWLGLCHCACDWGCLSEYGPISCTQWMFGYGPSDELIQYSSPPLRSGPYKSCPKK